MKSLLAICLLLNLNIEGSQAVAIRHKNINGSDDDKVNLDDEVDNLMDKYDNQDKPKKQPVFAQNKSAQQKKGGPSAAQIQDMEYNILIGNNQATNSAKADEDDMLQESMTKYKTEKKGEDVLTKENAQEAAVEIMEQRKKLDTMDAMEQVKGVFAQVWADHDISHKGYIDYSEGYQLMQDLFQKEA